MDNYDFIKNKQIEDIERIRKDVVKKVESNLRFFESDIKKGITADSLRNLIINLNMALQDISKAEGKYMIIEYIDSMKSE